MTDKDSGTVTCDCRAENFSYAQHGTVYRTAIAVNILYNLIFAIENQNTHLLVVQIGHFNHNQICRVARRFNLILLIELLATQTFADLQRGLNLAALGLSQSMFSAQLAKIDAEQPSQPTMPGQQLARQLQYIVPSSYPYAE